MNSVWVSHFSLILGGVGLACYLSDAAKSASCFSAW
jgi:hypothetical protein